jgi:hypothetical protein
VAGIGEALAPFSGVSRRSRRSEMEITRLGKPRLTQLYTRTVWLCIHDSTSQDMPITGPRPLRRFEFWAIHPVFLSAGALTGTTISLGTARRPPLFFTKTPRLSVGDTE